MRCFIKAMREYANFDGRSGRREYWLFIIGWAFFGALSIWIDGAAGTYNFRTGVAVVESFWFFGFLLPWMAATARRLHDTGRSGWFMSPFLLALVYFYIFAMPAARPYLMPYLAPAAFLALAWAVFMALPGNEGENAYGKPEQAWC